jgi:hypothetical protein
VPTAASRRARRRQPNNCCGERPCRRATSETTAPGVNRHPIGTPAGLVAMPCNRT